MKFAYYYFNDQYQKYKAAQSEDEKIKIAKDFFEHDAELVIVEMKRNLQ